VKRDTTRRIRASVLPSADLVIVEGTAYEASIVERS
jgi:hypothetical protein